MTPPPPLPSLPQGYFLLYESMLDSVLYARDKWLVDKSKGEVGVGRGCVHSLRILLQCSPTLAVSVLLPWETNMSGSPKFNIGAMSMVCMCVCDSSCTSHYVINPVGYKMNSMREDVLREPSIQVVDRQSTISSTDTIKV